MPECHLMRCQQERRLIRREFNKWTKNLLLQIGLETISKNHFQFEINLFNDEQIIPKDFNPNQTCLFCINHQECLSNKNLWLNNDTDSSINDDDENSPLDLSLKSTSTLNSQSDSFSIYNSEEFFLSTSHMNFDYLSQTFPNLNLLPINQYQLNSFQSDNYIYQLAKQMAYLRMLEEIDNQQNNKTVNSLNTSSSILTESIHVNQIINDIMNRTLNEIFEEQIKQGELLFIKKQNNNDDVPFLKTNQQYKHGNEINPSLSSVSSRYSPLIYSKNKSKSQSSIHISNRKAREVIPNSKIIMGMNGKQIRPKRGQYRRYQSEQLSKAVAAVLSNEMSVHKAGSYFGVPHSTLEYKVKERNSKLLTPMKTKTEISSILVNENNNHLTSMNYVDGDENESNNEEIQS